MLTKAKVVSNGFTYMVQGLVHGKHLETYEYTPSSRYGDTVKRVSNNSFGVYTRKVDRLEAAKVKRELVSHMVSGKVQDSEVA